MEVICINGRFTAGQLEFYAQHGVVTPVEKSLYTIREVVKHTNGEIGVRLEEIVNPEVPIKHPILGTIRMEPTWAASRFTHLDGSPLNKEEIDELIKEPEKVKIPDKWNS